MSQSRILFVKNISHKARGEDVYELFGKYGPIRQIRMGNSAKTFVIYEELGDAKQAFEHVNGFHLLERYLVVLYHRPAPRIASASVSRASFCVSMPPRKRQADSEEDEVESKAKKSKKEPLKPLDPDQPTNLTLPVNLTLPAKAEGTLRIAAWNVTSLASSVRKGLKAYVEAEDADVLVLTETKGDLPDKPEFLFLKQRYTYRYFGVDPKPGYSGTAVLSKIKPQNVTIGLPTLKEFDTNSRIVTLEFENTFIVGCYCPNAGSKLKTMDTKVTWQNALEPYLHDLNSRKPIIWLGDLNVAPKEIDLRHAKTNWNKTAGYTEQECNWFNALLEKENLVDVFRHKHPDRVGAFSYYSFRQECRVKGIGWRVDNIVLSQRLVDRAVDTDIRSIVYGASDHVPLFLDLRGTL